MQALQYHNNLSDNQVTTKWLTGRYNMDTPDKGMILIPGGTKQGGLGFHHAT